MLPPQILKPKSQVMSLKFQCSALPRAFGSCNDCCFHSLVSINTKEFPLSVTGKVRDDDVLVLPLDMVKTDSHNKAVEEVLRKFKKVGVPLNVSN